MSAPPIAAPQRKRRRQQQAIPTELRNEVLELARNHRAAFKADPELKVRVLRLTRALLHPRPRPRGRPCNPTVTRAIRLFRKFRRELPGETPRQLWSRVYPRVIPGYEGMSEMDQRAARDELRQKVSWRRRRKTRKIAAQLTV